MYRGSEAYDRLWVDEGADPDRSLDKFEWSGSRMRGASEKIRI